jgi:dihydroorotate dehydrogenase
MGFNNGGVDGLLANAAAVRYRGILGINIGKNFDTPIARAADDYRACLRKVHARADYVTVNISSPNTKNLRSLQEGDALLALLRALKDEQTALAATHGRRVPLAVKIAPDLDESQLDAIADVLVSTGMNAVIATNTTLSRDGVAGLPDGDEAGGLSGAPVRERSTAVVRGLAKRLGGHLPIIAAGGILSGADAREKIDAGAALVQVYSGLIYRGPALVGEAIRALA